MDSFYAGIATAVWLGILTSISPCPLATNIAAISFISKRIGSTKNILLAGLFYTIGRAAAYLGVAALVVTSLLSIPELAMFLQEYINLILGPLLIIVGLFLTELIKFGTGGSGRLIQSLSVKAEKGGVWGAALLGFIFALSFCPVSAALFFGSLLPLSLTYQSNILLPSLYGFGTALPVIAFAFVLSFGAQYIGKFFNQITKIEWWAQRITGAVFILIGLYLTWENIISKWF